MVDTLKAASPDAPVLHDVVGSNVVSRRVFTHGEPARAFEEAERRTSLDDHLSAQLDHADGRLRGRRRAPAGQRRLRCHLEFPGTVLAAPRDGASRFASRRASLRHRSPPNSGGSFGSKLGDLPVRRPAVHLRAHRGQAGQVDRGPAGAPRRRELRAEPGDPVEAAYDDRRGSSRLCASRTGTTTAPICGPRCRRRSTACMGSRPIAYRIRHVEVFNHIVVTNKCPTGAVRGFGGPQLYFAIERTMHKIAIELGLDPLDLMRRNLIPEGRLSLSRSRGRADRFRRLSASHRGRHAATAGSTS